MNWQSHKVKCPARKRAIRNDKATLDASRARLNMLSAKKARPRETP
jgi:hypothetical protein